MRLTSFAFAFLATLGVSLSECKNISLTQPKNVRSNYLNSSKFGLNKTLEAEHRSNRTKNELTTIANRPKLHLPEKNATDSNIPTWKLYRAHLRKANATARWNNIQSQIAAAKNHTSKHHRSNSSAWKISETNSSMPKIHKINNTATNISYVDFLLNFANLTVHYLPNVTVTNDSIKIHNTVYDRELKNRTFKVDYDKNEFFKDGKPFRYASGEMHYFRSFPETWRRKMRAMRAAGLNVVSTYIEWSLHNPQDDDQYDWTGLKNAEKFIRIAIEEDLHVILRPGPYICSERNGGGFPYWLVAKYPHIQLRTTDPDYLKEVRKWFAELMPRFIPYLYENGGPIILVQVENEYGVYGCDREYQHWGRDETQKYVRDKAVLFTNDIKDKPNVACGKIDGILATTDFNVDSNANIDKFWKNLRAVQPNGPCVNSEFYVGWGTYWFDKSERYTSIDQVVDSLDHQFQGGCSVNIYMFYGGSNYGFSTSTGVDSDGVEIGIPSYDYDAPISEAGDITPKYYEVREVVKKYLPMPDIEVPQNESKMALPPVELRPRTTLFSPWARFLLGSDVRQSNKPLLFENFTQDAGFLLYETHLDDSVDNPSTLTIPILLDRAIIYLNNTLVGFLSRKKAITSAKIDTSKGNLLQILVENVGRKSYGLLNETRGILSEVMLNGKSIERWNCTGFAFSDMERLTGLLDALDFVQQDHDMLNRMKQTSKKFKNEPIIFGGTFDVENGKANDTFIDTRGWGKGFIVINGFNLGRYWPLAGPQMSMYLPKELLKEADNSIIVVEMEQAPKDNTLRFSESAIFMNVISDEI